MPNQRPELNRLEVIRALKISNYEAVYATVHATLTGGAFQTGFALWLGANNFWMGLISAIPTFSALIQILSSYFVERRGERRRFTAWFSWISRLLWLPILLIPFALPDHVRLPAFVGLLLFSSILGNVPVPAFLSWMSDLVPAQHRGRYFGHRNMLAGITTMLVSLPAAWFLDLAVKERVFPEAYGYGGLFLIAVIGGAASFACILKQAEPPMTASTAEEGSGLKGMVAFYRIPFADENFRRLMAFNCTLAFAQFFAAPFYTVYAIQTLKLNFFWLQIFGTINSLTALLSMPLWGYLSDKYGGKPLLWIGILGVGLLPAMWAFTNKDNMTFTLINLLFLHMLGGMSWAGVGLTQFNMLIGVTPAEGRSVYVGAMSAVTGIVGGIAPIIGGALITALKGTTLHPFGFLLSNYQIVFLFNSTFRFLALIPLSRVPSTGDTTAREILSQLGTSRVRTFRQMRSLRRGQSEGERVVAAKALRESRTALAVDELITALDDPSPQVREESATALGEIGDPRAVEALIEHLHDPASGIIDEACIALGRIGDSRAIAPVGNVLLFGQKSDQIAAAKSLSYFRNPSASFPLSTYLGDYRDGGALDVQEACIVALGHLGLAESAAVLIPYVQHEDRTMRIVTVRALGELANPDASPSLIQLLETEEDEATIAHLCVSLAFMGASESVPLVLSRASRLESKTARRQALHAVGILIGEEANLYPLLGMESFARDAAVSRFLKEQAKKTRQDVDAPGIDWNEILEAYVEMRFDAALEMLASVLTISVDVDCAPARHAFEWVVQTASHRSINSEEFLLGLFAARRLADGS